MAKMKEGNRTETAFALKCFERIIGPKRVSAITTQDIDEYVAKRSAETKGSTVREGKGPQKRKRTTNRISPASVNKELRYLRAALRKANKWGLLPQLPEFTFLKVPVKVPTFISPEDFAALYDAAPKATRPDSQFFPAGDWWRALLVTAYMTGWRISEILTLRWEDVDLEAGTAFLRAENTKGNREDFVRLHPIVVDHMRKLKNFSPVVFPWMDAERRLWREFYDLQDMAKIKPRGKPHYGFHDLRRGFATMNADRLSADTLQRMMRHKSYSTTQLYVNMARQIQSSVDKLFVPELKPTKTAPRILG
jgi:integrase